MDLNTSTIFTVTFCVLVYHGEAVVVSVFIFLSRSKDSTSPSESCVIIILRYFVLYQWISKFVSDSS